MDPKTFVLEDALRAFLAEDLGHGDITTEALIPPHTRAKAQVVCHESATVAGLDGANLLLQHVGCVGTATVKDGGKVKPETEILRINGRAASILGVERTLLNLLSHMSGVATATAELVEIARKNKATVRIACTRKTLPGLRYFEKRAVELGGGDTHRLGLDDAVLIKDNHLSIAGSIAECVNRAKAKVSFTKKVEVEVTRPDQGVEAAEAGADIILLDNMGPETVEKTVVLLESKNLRSHVVLEASGGITKENLAGYAKTGVDVISVGRITHSAKSIDMSLELKPSRAKQGKSD